MYILAFWHGSKPQFKLHCKSHCKRTFACVCLTELNHLFGSFDAALYNTTRSTKQLGADSISSKTNLEPNSPRGDNEREN
jgi:hypothetical protein